jgi:hypothetical protein
VLPLVHFVDSGGPDGVAATVEMDGHGEIYPVVYVRQKGNIEEHLFPPDPLHDFESDPYRRQLESLLERAGLDSAVGER